MRLVTVKMPETYLEGLDELVKMGRYSSRSEAIRIAVRELLKRELWGIPEAGGIESAFARREPRRVLV
jgi:antitoxin ParD1/3/4